MINILKKAAYKHGYLFITAAWLYTLSFLFTNYFSFDSNATKVATVLSRHIADKEAYFNQLFTQTSLIESLISDSLPPVKEELDKLTDNIGLYSYVVNDLGNPVPLYWNTNKMEINAADIAKPDGHYAVTYQQSYFVLIKKTIRKDDKAYIIAGLIPVYWQYLYENSNLTNHFEDFPGLARNYIIDEKNIGPPIVDETGKPLYFVSKKDNALFDQPENISIILRVAAIILLMVFINSLATAVVAQIGLAQGFLFLFSVVFTARLISYYFAFPFNFRKLDLFDADIYASSYIHPSLGDLLINAILFYWMVSFIKFHFSFINNKLQQLTQQIKKICSVAALLALPLLTISATYFLSSLIIDSSDKLSFDVTNFFSLNEYTLIGFIIVCFIVISYYYLVQLLCSISRLAGFSLYWRLIILLAGALVLVALRVAFINSTGLTFIVVVWMLLFYVLTDMRKQDESLSFYDAPFFMAWSIFLMATVTVLLMYQNTSLEQKKRKDFADKISLSTQQASETIINMAVAQLSDIFLQKNFSRFYDPYENAQLKQKLINANFRGFVNNFNTRIYTFDNNKQPLNNEDSASYLQLKALIANKAVAANNKEGLYYYETGLDQFVYIYEKDVPSSSGFGIAGYVFMVISPRNFTKETLTPELFRQVLYDNEFSTGTYPYAIYVKNHLFKSNGNYNFNDTISKADIPKVEFYFTSKNGYSELWTKGSDNKIIVVPKKEDWFSASVTFFAYIFGIFIVLVLLQHFGNLLFKTHFKWLEIKKIFRFSLRTQIQTIIVSVSLVSFIIIGITTITFFIARFDKANDEKLVSTVRIVVNEIERLAKSRVVASEMFDVNNLDLNLAFENNIVEIAATHNTDINFYDLSGNLQASSQQYLFYNKIVTTKMNRVAYDAMHYKRYTQFIQKEQVADFAYRSIYVPVKDEMGNTLSYLNIPYINLENELNQEISNFLIALIILNALIFIMAGAIAIWFTKRITSSFTFIADKMKLISFGGANEIIEWKKDDELGELVNEYNKMVKKLTDSAEALARSEREGAWREMARQVAHEIKNPLTPMKLSIQYLQKAIDNNQANVKELSKQVAVTLVEQIDQLSKIAGDFSQFANIAIVNEETFDLTDVLASIIRLFSADASIKIQWQKIEGAYTITADKIQMNRLFTNLIKNAIEASNTQNNIEITITQEIKQQQIIIAITDSGTGIPAAMQHKIFTPNFTTKSSGTGLGLAICKGIVEKANGQIWFQTNANKGTTFFVSLPVILPVAIP